MCWLLEDFLAEHDEGLHEGKPAHGCGKCSPVLSAQIAAKALHVLDVHERTLSDAQARMNELSVLKPTRKRVVSTSSPRVASSHAQCDHENTKAARARCRAARRKEQ